jgi:heat shock protein HslJ
MALGNRNLIWTATGCALMAVGLAACTPDGDGHEQPRENGAEVSESVAPVTAAPAAHIVDGHSSRNALDWNGTYTGVLPCADCAGIETRVTLMSSGEFLRTTTYLGKEEHGRTERGVFQWNDRGSAVRLQSEQGTAQQYQVGENMLFHLDQEGNRITGDLAEAYQLMKNISDSRLEGKNWMLVELAGREVRFENSRQQATLMFDGETGRLSGSDGCNRLMGAYELGDNNRIGFGKLASTMMACPDMEIADRFREVLELADSYLVADGRLTLNRADMEPLARFQLEQ